LIQHLERWQAAGLLDGETAERIRSWEARNLGPSFPPLRIPSLAAVSLEGVLLRQGFCRWSPPIGRRHKFLNVSDEHSRLRLAILVGRRCKAKDVVAVLEELTSLCPTPAYIRSDNGPEFIAQSLRDWCEASSTTRTASIEPLSPWENGFAESFNGRFRDEFLNSQLFFRDDPNWVICRLADRRLQALHRHGARG
jgi:transposase InsO family protein